MRRKLSAWGWAGAGAVIVLWIAWLAVTIWTAVEVRHDHATITRIERVIGIGGGHASVGHGSRPQQSTTTGRTAPTMGGGGASTGHSPHSPSGPHHGGGPRHGHGGGHHHGRGGSTTERNTETVVIGPSAAKAEPPARTALGGLTESAGASAEGLRETATGTTEGVEATTCTLAKVLCPR